MPEAKMPIWEVFIRARAGLAHRHAGSVHAADAEMALQAARDTYTRRGEGLSIWVVPSAAITASDPSDKDSLFEPTGRQDLPPPDLLRGAGRSRAHVT
jgi:ring-1,2-phenylacetyl-CoA epoxidase subunit PaaB